MLQKLMPSKGLCLILFLCLTACKTSLPKEEQVILATQAEQIKVGPEVPPAPVILALIAPYKKQLDLLMNEVLSYSPEVLTKSDGELNTALGNMMADAVLELADSVYYARSAEHIDLVLLNHGGIRSSLPAGPVSVRDAFSLMPFENEVVVVSLSGKKVQELVRYLIDAGIAHPVAGLELVLNENNAIKKLLIQGAPLRPDGTYQVATSDYLYQGGDNMLFFKDAPYEQTDYKIRDLLIDYFKKNDTLDPVEDRRFIIEP